MINENENTRSSSGEESNVAQRILITLTALDITLSTLSSNVEKLDKRLEKFEERLKKVEEYINREEAKSEQIIQTEEANELIEIQRERNFNKKIAIAGVGLTVVGTFLTLIGIIAGYFYAIISK